MSDSRQKNRAGFFTLLQKIELQININMKIELRICLLIVCFFFFFIFFSQMGFGCDGSCCEGFYLCRTFQCKLVSMLMHNLKQLLILASKQEYQNVLIGNVSSLHISLIQLMFVCFLVLACKYDFNMSLIKLTMTM